MRICDNKCMVACLVVVVHRRSHFHLASDALFYVCICMSMCIYSILLTGSWMIYFHKKMLNLQLKEQCNWRMQPPTKNHMKRKKSTKTFTIRASVSMNLLIFLTSH